MTDPQGPWRLQETVDRLEAEIVDVGAADDDAEAADVTRDVPGAPEPPD